jgi:hypothetical protein
MAAFAKSWRCTTRTVAKQRNVVAFDPAALLETLLERHNKGLPFGIPLRTAAGQEPDPTHLIGLLRARRERPRRRATEQRDERAFCNQAPFFQSETWPIVTPSVAKGLPAAIARSTRAVLILFGRFLRLTG